MCAIKRGQIFANCKNTVYDRRVALICFVDYERAETIGFYDLAIR
jgi:hypothetical protein